MKTYAVDIDGTLCVEQKEYWKYAEAIPIKPYIKRINKLYDEGNTVVLYTSRYPEDEEVTKTWLKENGVKYHRIIFGKFRADIYVDSNAKIPEAL